MKEYRFPQEIRELIGESLPQDTAVFGQTPDLRYTFTPAGHSRALHPDTMLVVGIRGAGKSFWWTVLQSSDHRQMVAHLLAKSSISEATKVSVGFGEPSSPDDYPGKDTLVQLIQQFDARQVWRTIALRHVIKGAGEDQSLLAASWPDSVSWMVEHPEEEGGSGGLTDSGSGNAGRLSLGGHIDEAAVGSDGPLPF